MSRIRLFAAALCFLFVAGANAANLLNNGSFDTDKNGWSFDPHSTALKWQHLDALAQPGSGALAVIVNSEGLLQTHVTQCVPVTGGATYALGAKIMIPGQQPAANASVSALQYQSVDCTGSGLDGAGAQAVEETSNGRFTAVAVKNYAVSPDARSVQVGLVVTKREAGMVTAYFDDVIFAPAGGCLPDGVRLCLNGGRFEVKATYWVPDAGNPPAYAHVVQLTSDSGYMWFFDRNNVEVTIKVLGACAISPTQWVFAAGMTNVDVTIEVTDTVTKAVQTYRNPAGKPFEAIVDTRAFGCP